MTLRTSTGNGAPLVWVKSSYSSNDGPECVEVAVAPGAVRVRDSKVADGPQLAVPASAWTDFVVRVTRP
ncbi:DUF397 domain-containing protein [Streptomyces phytohabitans]|uniref:DUF397 domain-containing protein n=1 Tax=Streptomyces phytohabitans TaxID=1150371 RepID=UPI00345C3E10